MKRLLIAGFALTALTSPITFAPQSVVLNPTVVAKQLNREVESFFTTDTTQVSYDSKDEECLARNVFFESGVEDDNGMIAVAQVTLNRLKSKRWGDSICAVVHAKAQFSWTLFKKTKNATPTGDNWKRSREITKKVLAGLRISALKKSLFYHTDYIAKPSWVDDSKYITQIGQHLFYTTEKVVFKAKKKRKGKRKTA